MSDIALKIGYFLAECVSVFAVSFAASFVVLYVRHGKGAFHWKEALRLAVALGIGLPLYSRIKGFF